MQKVTINDGNKDEVLTSFYKAISDTENKIDELIDQLSYVKDGGVSRLDKSEVKEICFDARDKLESSEISPKNSDMDKIIAKILQSIRINKGKENPLDDKYLYDIKIEKSKDGDAISKIEETADSIVLKAGDMNIVVTITISNLNLYNEDALKRDIEEYKQGLSKATERFKLVNEVCRKITHGIYAGDVVIELE